MLLSHRPKYVYVLNNFFLHTYSTAKLLDTIINTLESTYNNIIENIMQIVFNACGLQTAVFALKY